MASSARRRLWRVAAVAGGGGELGPWPRRPWLGAGRRGERGGAARGEFGLRPQRPWRQRRMACIGDARGDSAGQQQQRKRAALAREREARERERGAAVPWTT